MVFANKVYAVKSTIDPNCIILRNLGNIPSKFEWEDVNHLDVISSALSPQSGVIEPKSEIHIKFKFTVKLYGKFDFFFKCHLEELDLPIGFQLTACVFGLDISYELPPKIQEVSLMRQKMLKKIKHSGLTSIDHNSTMNSIRTLSQNVRFQLSN
jgi:hypothetical protein